MKTTNLFTIAVALCLLGMHATPVSAASCDSPPLFDMSGPPCSAARQGLECKCSECFQWDPAAGAKFYQIQRCDGSGKNCTTVGNTRWRNRVTYTYPSGAVVPEVRPTFWCAAWDDPFPLTGASYTYSVRGCVPGPRGPVCSDRFSNSIAYVGAPYMCFEHGIEVPCITTISASFAFGIDVNGDRFDGTVGPDE